MPTPRRSPRTAPPSPVIARSAATWQSVLLLHLTSNLCLGAGFYPALSAAPSQLSPVGRHPRVPPPMIAVPTTAGHIGPALQDFRRGRCPPIAPYAPLLAKTLSLRGAERRGNPYSLRAASHHYVSVGRGDCPPSCQPVSAHCRGRQSGHFLETASLLPPPAARRRFPRPPMRR